MTFKGMMVERAKGKRDDIQPYPRKGNGFCCRGFRAPSVGLVGYQCFIPAPTQCNQLLRTSPTLGYTERFLVVVTYHTAFISKNVLIH